MTTRCQTLLQVAEARATGLRRPEMVSLKYRQVSPDSLVSISEQVEHQLEARFKTRFWANKAQYQHALQQAHENLAYGVYGPLLDMAYGIRGALMEGNERKALSIAEGMVDVIIGRKTGDEVLIRAADLTG